MFIESTPSIETTSRAPVAVLCCAVESVYHSIAGVDCFDKRRDVRSFAGGSSVVAHPPCRSWSAYCAHQAKPEPGEKELGPLCVEWLKSCGGVLEHPAHSRLFQHCGLPLPGESRDGLWTAEVWQAWWGYPMKKATWLCFSGISPKDVTFPLALHPHGVDRRRQQVMSKNQRSATHPALARWLVDVASLASVAVAD